MYGRFPEEVKDRLLKANHNTKTRVPFSIVDVKDRLLKANHNIPSSEYIQPTYV